MTPFPGDQRPNDPHQDTRLYVLLLAILVGLVLVIGVTYLSWQHPSLATPIQCGGTIATVLLAGVAIVISRR